MSEILGNFLKRIYGYLYYVRQEFESVRVWAEDKGFQGDDLSKKKKKNNNTLPPPSPKKFLKKSFGWILNIKPNEHMEGTY